MPAIGDYRNWVTLLPRSLAAADATGERVESWPDPPADTTAHAALIEGPTGGESTATPRQSFKGLRLRFRCKVTLAAVDHVKLKETGETFAVAGVWTERAEHGGWQTVCDLTGPL